MKRKSIFYSLMIFVFSLCGTLGFFGGFQTNASSIGASVWDGEYATSVTDSDYYVAGGNTISIFSAKGLSYFAYQVNNSSGYRNFSNMIIRLENDIDLAGHNWLPIGGYNGNTLQGFQGTFDGNGHYIYNLKIDSSETFNDSGMISFDSRAVGFFGALADSGKVTNLHLRNVDIDVAGESETNVGSIVGYLYNSGTGSDAAYNATYLQSCSASGDVDISYYLNASQTGTIGGLVGKLENASVSYSRSDVDITLSSASTNSTDVQIGGVAGYAKSAGITYSFNEGNLTATSFSNAVVGGLAGYTEGQESGMYVNRNFRVTNSYNSGSIASNAGILGGLVGLAGNDYVQISTSYNSGDVSYTAASLQSGDYVGGIVGHISPSSLSEFALQNLLSVGVVSVSGTARATVFNGSTPTEISNVFYDANYTNSASSGTTAMQNLTALAKTKDFYLDEDVWASGTWTFSDSAWQISPSVNGGFPYLKVVYDYGNSNNDTDYSEDISLKGDGSVNNPYLIQTAGDLGWLSFNYSSLIYGDNETLQGGSYKHFSLQNDIDLGGRTWQPIGTAALPFTGVFDGNGYTISGISCSLQDQFSYHAFFGVAQNAVIKNLTLGEFNFINAGTTERASFVGLANGNVYLVNCVDNSNEDLDAVGNVSGQLFVVYGQDNLDSSGEPVALNLPTGNVTIGNLLTVDGRSGTFFSKERSLYSTYSVMIDDQNKLLLPTDTSNTIIDTTFGQTLLPGLSTELGNSDVVIREGFYLLGYRFDGTSTNAIFSDETLTNSNLTNLLSTSRHNLYAVWQELDVRVYVVYNQYEKDNFASSIDSSKYTTVTSFESAEPGTVYLNENSGEVFAVYEMGYDTFVSQYETAFNCPSIDGTPLRDGDFELAGIYYGYENKNFVDGQTIDETSGFRINGDLPNIEIISDGTTASASATYYAKWQGVETAGKAIRIELSKGEGATEFASNFDLSSAVKAISITKHFGANSEETNVYDIDDANGDGYSLGDVLEVSGENILLNLGFDTRLSDSLQHWISVSLELQTGFITSGALSFEGTNVDVNFGDVTTSSGLSNVALSDLSNIRFYNLNPIDGVYQISASVVRQNLNWTTTISENVNWAFAPVLSEDFASVHIWNNTTSSFQIFDSLSDKDYIGFDFAHNLLITSDADYDTEINSGTDWQDFFVTENDVTKMIFRYSIGQENNVYYVYEHNSTTEETTLYQADFVSIDEITYTEMLVSYQAGRNGEFVFNYYVLTDFAVLASTNEDTLMFNNYYTGDQPTILKSATDNTETVSEKPTKLLYVFNDLSEKTGNFVLQTFYTMAYFDFEFYTDGLDETGNGFETLLNSENEPNIYINSHSISVNENGEVQFLVEASDFYKAAFGSSIALPTRAGESFAVGTGDIDVEVEFSNTNVDDPSSDETTSANSAYETDFNNLNSGSYFQNSQSATTTMPTVTVYQKGQTLEGFGLPLDICQNDTFLVTLPFTEATQPNGLKPGHYTVKIKVVDVNYSLQFKTAFVDEQGSTAFSDDSSSNINFSVNGVAVNGSQAITQNNLKYGDSVSLSTSLGEDNGYVFGGYYVIEHYKTIENDIFSEEKTVGTYLNANQDYQTTYSALNNQLGTLSDVQDLSNLGKTGDNRFLVTIYAVYERKQTRVFVYDRVLLLNEDGNGQDNRYFATNLSLDFSINGNATTNGESYVNYYYNSASVTDSALSNLNFEMSGTNANGYYVAGYALVDATGEYIKDIYNENIYVEDTNIDLFGALHEKIKAGQTEDGQTYYLMPIIRQKTIDVYFHAGTGDETNIYGDQKNGHVFSATGEETTDSTVKLSGIYFGNSIGLISAFDGDIEIDGAEPVSQIVVNDYFASRTGYILGDIYGQTWNIVNFGSFAASTLNLNIAYFGTSLNNELHLYRLWRASSFNLIFRNNGGTFSSSVTDTNYVVVRTEFDNNNYVGNVPTAQSISRTGYDLAGWGILLADETYEKIFESDGSLVEGSDLFDENGNYVSASDTNLYAMWENGTFDVQINFNSANTEETEKTYQIKYNSTFANLLDGEETVALSEISPEREGYIFDGFYIVSGNSQIEVTDETVFSEYLQTCNLAGTPALTIYARWVFDSAAVSLSFVSNMLENLTYNGQPQTVYLAQYFTSENFTATGYEISVADNSLSITLPTEMNSSVVLTLTSSTAMTNSDNLSFQVENAGEFYVTLTIQIQDNATYLNLGMVSSQNYQFGIVVDQSELDFEIDDTARMLSNAKRIIQPFLTSSQWAAADSLNTLSGFASYIKTQDSTATSATDEEIYEFVMVKYYLLLTASTGEEHNTYRTWTYQNYGDYLMENSESVTALLENLTYFAFYDYQTRFNLEVDKAVYNFGLTANENSVSEIEIESLIVYSTSPLQPNGMYQLRMYLQNIDEENGLANYNVLQDGENAYLNAGYVYLLPQVLEIENTGADQSYFEDGSFDHVSIDWFEGISDTIEYDSETFYKIGENLYANANLVTSSIGSQTSDTTYTFFDETNNLYFDNVRIVSQTVYEDGSASYQYVTNRFKLVLDENETFTILKTDGLVNLNFFAKYLTLNENNNAEFGDVDETMAESLLNITRVVYQTEDGTTHEITENLEEKLYTIEGSSGGTINLFEIRANNKNQVSIFVTSLVKELTVSISERDLSEYITFSQWSAEDVYTVSDNLEDNTSVTFSFTYQDDALTITSDKGDEIVQSTTGVTEIDYNAVWTDLVPVHYDYNLPEDYAIGTVTQLLLKLGTSTVDELIVPSVDGLELSSLTAATQTGSSIDYRDLFAGGTFRGLNVNNPHLPIYLTARWAAMSIEGTANVDVSQPIRMAALTFEEMAASSIYTITNFNDQVYNYTYQWYFEDEPLLTGSTLTLAGNGRYAESGTYKLVITAQLKSKFFSSLDDTAQSESSVEVEFELSFERTKVLEVVFDETQSEYSASAKNPGLTITFQSFDRDTGDFGEEIEQSLFLDSAMFSKEIKLGEQVVDQMRNAGIYTITLSFDSEYYDASSLSSLSFTYTVNPAVVELSPISAEKTFNADEPSLNRTSYLSNEYVQLSFTREAGEDIGEYDIYFNEIVGDIKTNYTFTFGNVAVYENGQLTEAGSSTAVGTFEITKGGTLRLSYETSEILPNALKAPYDENGYTLSLSNGVLQILNGTETYQSLTLNLYDVLNNKYLTTGEAYDLVISMLNSASTNFVNLSTPYQTATNCAVYTYQITNLNNAYFQQIEFEQGFSFEIERRTVDVSAFTFEKEFDGSATVYYDLDGQEIDLESYDGVYVQATFASFHAGENISVGLSLRATDESVILSNYQLSSTNATGTITKLSATYTVSLGSASYVYGNVSINNFQNLISTTQVMSGGRDVSSLLFNGYYSIDYSLQTTAGADVSSNSNGYLYVGDYKFVAESSFQDFDMTLSLPEFSVTPLNITKTLSQGYIVISESDTVEESYSETLTVPNTGDQIVLEFVPTSLTSGTQASAGFYELTLKESSFLSGSVTVTLAENSRAFEVTASNEILYVRIDDTSILTQNYNSQEFVFSATKDGLTISNSSMQTTLSSTFSFYRRTDTGEESVDASGLTFTSISITSTAGTMENAGTYRLSLNAALSGSEYANVVFYETYNFVINAIEIDLQNFEVTKTYDGSSTQVITNLSGMIDGDNVSVLARYASLNAGEDIAVSLFLQGTDSGNYRLTNAPSTGSISKADATITLTKTEFVYGEIRNDLALPFEISSSTTIYQTQYVIAFSIAKADGTELEFSGNSYLYAGSYTVSLDEENSISANFNLNFDATDIEVLAYNLNIVFSEDGIFAVEHGSEDALSNTFDYNYTTPLYEEISLTLTRETGSEVGYYQVLSGTTTDTNYSVSVTDNSPAGFFRIIKAQDILYMLASDKDELSTDSEGMTISFEYDGFLYDTISVSSENGQNSLVLTSSINSTARRSFALNAYTYDGEKYTKSDIQVENLTANVFFMNYGRDVGTYYIYANNASSSTNEVRLGKLNQAYNFILNIIAKQIYFKEGTLDNLTVEISQSTGNAILKKTFDNQDATFSFEDASAILTGIGNDDILGLNLSFMTEDDQIARYAGTSYTLQATLRGDNVDNYHLNLQLQGGDTTLTGAIDRAGLTIYIQSQNFTYGDEIDLEFSFVSDTGINLDAYTQSMVIEFAVDTTGVAMSGSGNLPVGEYSMVLTFIANDFVISKYVVNNVEADDYSAARVYVAAKALTISQKDIPLRDVFTKTYDASQAVTIFDEQNELLFNVSGTLGGDNVSVASANYAQATLGQSIQVDFTLSGNDSANYTISPWMYGVIEAINVELVFDYDTDVWESNVERAGLTQISQLNFPFVSSDLTSNSTGTTSTRNFPTSLMAKPGQQVGQSFSHWTMNFAVSEGSAEYLFLENAKAEINFESTYQDGIYSITVGNNERTVNLLNTLINDDTENLFGLNFRENDNLQVTFTPNWTTLQQSIQVYIVDNNNQPAEYGKVTINETQEITEAFLGQFDYGSTITLQAESNAHCYFLGFYDGSGSIYTTSGSVVINGNQMTISNLNQNYVIYARFEVQHVDVVMNVEPSDDLTIPTNFVYQNGSYVWQTNYMNLADLLLSGEEFAISKTGHNLTEFSVAWRVQNGSSGSTTVSQENFGSTTISDLLGSLSGNSITLTLTPSFEAQGIRVNLYYGYQEDDAEKVTTIYVPYGSTFDQAAGWEENPIRTGYDFDGWWTSDGSDNDDWGTQVSGTTTMTSTEEQNIYAKWNLASFGLRLTAQNATISNASITFNSSNGVYTADDQPFGTIITFDVTPNAGYRVSLADWEDYFVLYDDDGDGTVSVTLTMPGEDVDFTLPIEANTNSVTISGDLKEFSVFDITNGEETELLGNPFEIATGRKIRIDVTAQDGYHISSDVTFDDETGLTINKILDDDGYLTAIEIEGISKDLSITFSSTARQNTVSLGFDHYDRISSLEAGGITYPNISEETTLFVATGATLEVTVTMNHGYELDTTNFTSDDNLTVSISGSDGTYIVLISDVSTDSSLTLQTLLAKFTISVEVISYNEAQEQVNVPENIATVSGGSQVEANFGSTVTLHYEMESTYSFAGWSTDGSNIFDSSQDYSYTVQDDATIYAIFSKSKYNISLGTLNYYTVGNEYGEPDRVQTIYSEITGHYFDGEEEISGIELYFGASKTITFQVPDGFRYYGYGYRNGDEVVVLQTNPMSGQRVDVRISSSDLVSMPNSSTLFMIVEAYNISINFETKIDIDGVREEDVDVGWMQMQAQDGSTVNAYGYLEGTRVHYSDNSFASGALLSNKNFTVVAYTNDSFYLRVEARKSGYRFYSLVANRPDVELTQVEVSNEYAIYQISGFVGGQDELEIEVLFRPQLNLIDISFTNNGAIVDGGAFTFNISEENSRKIWTSGREYSSVLVSAYTDSEFEVTAFIRAGYNIDPLTLTVIDENNLIVGDITYHSLSLLNTGYTAMITFSVGGYLGTNAIQVVVTPTKYNVKLMEDATTLAIIKNVEFDSLLNLSQNNSANIEILDDRISYANGRLNVVIPKAEHYFAGYFTSQNGAGVQYINSEGGAINAWQENGYALNTQTSRYELTENAALDPETGEITISLYIYWSYWKTRINISFEPNINANYTAQDVVTGVDYTNSWFYGTAPLYIEVSFNTNVTLVAPEFNGYTFYKFVISQRTAQGVWLTDVVAYNNNLPWSTNEFDQIVECNIRIVYFAKVDVSVNGGDGTYTIIQETEDNQAANLISQGYVDTTKEFTIQAHPAEGYTFLYWRNVATGQVTFNSSMTLTANSSINLVMYVQGQVAVFNFEDYDPTFGQILTLEIVSRNGSYNTLRMGSFSGDDFIKTVLQTPGDANQTGAIKVGDRVTFIMSVDYGFGVTWNRDDITFVEYSSNYYYFEMIVSADCAGQILDIIPTFEDEVLSIYVSKAFEESQIVSNALDGNNEELAGYVVFNGNRTNVVTSAYGIDITIQLVTNSRYAISSITLRNYGNAFENILQFVDESGNLILPRDFLEEQNIVGTVQMSIEYEREFWEEQNLQTTELEGGGTSRNPYIISTQEDLTLMMKFVNSGERNSAGTYYKDANYVLANDIDLQNFFWTPIGTTENAFNGRFNFNGHRIFEVHNAYTYDTVSYNGLFGVIGAYAQFTNSTDNLWYVYLIVAILVVVIVLLIVLIYTNKKKKKRREELAKK